MLPASTALRRVASCLLAAAIGAAVPVLAQVGPAKVGAALAAPPPKADAPSASLPPGDRIVAIVNTDVITTGDVTNRARLFALSTGMPMSKDIMDRLKPQIVRQLIDERLRMQEAERRKIVIPDQAIASSIHEIEARNNMPAGALRQRLSVDGVGQRTLINQIRAQLAWTQVLRERLGDRLQISEADIQEQMRLQGQLTGKTEYRVAEIFIPIDDPAHTADAQRFAETVILELRSGAPFPIVAAQFSQSQGALEGGDAGWVQTSQLDPAVAQLVTQMPPGAISNPVRVPGGFSIVTLLGKREIGRQMATALSLRQVFLPFTQPLNPQAPTEQQRQTLEKAKGISASAHSCEQMDELAKANNSPRPADPGETRLEGVNPPQFRQMLATIPIGKATQPLVSQDGIAVLMVCSREEKNMGTVSKQDIQRYLVNERVELLSRQLLRDLRRQSTIELRGGV
ncbi:MAG: peptidylprolyl isomerase [Acetobacteraceae bacterium]